MGDAIARPGLEEKYPLPKDVGLPGYDRWHLAGPDATGAEQGIAYAPRNFNVSKTATVENLIRRARDATSEQGGEVFYDFRALCRTVGEHEGVQIRVVESVTWNADIRAAGSERLVPIIHETAKVATPIVGTPHTTAPAIPKTPPTVPETPGTVPASAGGSTAAVTPAVEPGTVPAPAGGSTAAVTPAVEPGTVPAPAGGSTAAVTPAVEPGTVPAPAGGSTPAVEIPLAGAEAGIAGAVLKGILKNAIGFAVGIIVQLGLSWLIQAKINADITETLNTQLPQKLDQLKPKLGALRGNKKLFIRITYKFYYWQAPDPIQRVLWPSMYEFESVRLVNVHPGNEELDFGPTHDEYPEQKFPTSERVRVEVSYSVLLDDPAKRERQKQ